MIPPPTCLLHPLILDLIDQIDLELLFDTNTLSLKPDLSGLRNKSQFFPSVSLNSNVNLFLKQVTREVEDLTLSHNPSPNLTRNLHVAFNHLKSYTHLVIKPSDKGVNVVVYS